MNTIELCSKVREQTRKRLIEIHIATGIPYSTLEAIKRGRTKDPRGLTLDKLREYFSSPSAQS